MAIHGMEWSGYGYFLELHNVKLKILKFEGRTMQLSL